MADYFEFVDRLCNLLSDFRRIDDYPNIRDSYVEALRHQVYLCFNEPTVQQLALDADAEIEEVDLQDLNVNIRLEIERIEGFVRDIGEDFWRNAFEFGFFGWSVFRCYGTVQELARVFRDDYHCPI